MYSFSIFLSFSVGLGRDVDGTGETRPKNKRVGEQKLGVNRRSLFTTKIEGNSFLKEGNVPLGSPRRRRKLGSVEEKSIGVSY